MIRQATLPGSSLKKTLITLLTDIRADTSAHQYCGLILKAKQILDPSLNIPPTKSCENVMTVGEIFLQTKELMYDGNENLGCATAGAIVARLKSTVLPSVDAHHPSDTMEPLLRLLLGMRRSAGYDYMNKNYGLVGEYTVKRLVTATDWFLISHGDTNSIFDLPPPEKAVENLQNAQCKLAKYSSYRAEDILSTVFHIGRTQLEFSEEEKKEVGAFMPKVLEPIQMRVEDLTRSSSSTLSSLLQKRSSLQFLLDDYVTFPDGKLRDHYYDEDTKNKELAENEALRKKLYEDKISGGIKHVDNLLKTWRDNLSGGKVDRKREGSPVLDDDKSKWCEDETYLRKAGAYEVPKSHIWWADSIEKCVAKNKC